MVLPAFDPQPLLTGAPETELESPAFDRPLRIGVLLDGLTTERWVAKILQDITTAPFLRLSLVMVDASDDPMPPTWREWLALQRAEAPHRLWEWYQATDYRRFRREGVDPFEPVDVTPLVREATLFR